jgi:tetratricopeptide (TPR) repeat protein
MNPPTDWTTPIVIAAAGIILGALVVFYFINRRKAGPTIAVDAERKDLEAKRDALVAQLRALPDDAVDERARLETETANVLRRLDQHAAPASPATAAASSNAMNPTVKGFLWGAGSVAALGALFYFVSNAATPRPAGEMATGGITSQQQQQQQPQQPQAPPDPMVQQMEAAVQKDPNNTNLRLDLAQMYLERDNLMGVFEQTKVVLDREPKNARALTFGALVRMAMGEVDTATDMLQQATRNDAKSLDSWVALAWVYAQTNRMKDAEGAIAKAIEASPENRARLEVVLEQMKAQVAQAAQQPQQAAGAMPADHPPVAPAPAAAQGPTVRVSLQLDPAATRRSGVLFVIARNPQGGPPVAVKRVMAAGFPLTVELTSADSMLGQPLPASFRVEARLDSDGDAATKPPTDPSGMQDGVTPGAAITLALK